jgi:hypothetical protein
VPPLSHVRAPLAPAPPAVEYAPRRPQDTILHRLVREHYATFVAYTEATYAAPLPRYVPFAFERYLGCGDFSRGFVVGAGEDATSYPFETSCLQTCVDLQTQGPYACGACLPAAVRIGPGATRDVVWNGTGLRAGYTMPASCWADPQQTSTCSRIVAGPPGMWAVQAAAFRDCTGNCTCKADGTCSGTASGQQASADPADFSYPSATEVNVVFSACAFGCPG